MPINISWQPYGPLSLPYINYGQPRETPINQKIIVAPGSILSGSAEALFGTSGLEAASAFTGFAGAAGKAIGGTLPYIGTAGLGLLGGLGLSSIFGKAPQPQTQTTPVSPFQNTQTWNYSPQWTTTTNITGDWSKNIISNSPYASITKGNISGSATSTPTLTPTFTINPSQPTTVTPSLTGAPSTDWTTLALIGGIAIIGYAAFSSKKK